MDALATDPEDPSRDDLIPLPPMFGAPGVHVHSSLGPALPHAISALEAITQVLSELSDASKSSSDSQTPRSPPKWRYGIRHVLSRIQSRTNSKDNDHSPITQVTITGHGLGAAVGMIVAASLAESEVAHGMHINTHLFGLPRIGDKGFTAWVDDIVRRHSQGRARRPNGTRRVAQDTTATTLALTRVTSYADPVPRLPPHLHHPASVGELWVGADPRHLYACEMTCAASQLPMDKASLLDHAGPYAGVWVGVGCGA